MLILKCIVAVFIMVFFILARTLQLQMFNRDESNSVSIPDVKQRDIGRVQRIIYDASPLTKMALKKQRVIISKTKHKKIDCSTSAMECNSSRDCNAICAQEALCIEGMCYTAKVNSRVDCQNGGVPVSYFKDGIFNYEGCICPPTHIGRWCEILNQLY